MFTHHIVTVTLITFSYVTNLTRVGTLTLCLHDAADVVLEVRKYVYHQCLYMVFTILRASMSIGRIYYYSKQVFLKQSSQFKRIMVVNVVYFLAEIDYACSGACL